MLTQLYIFFFFFNDTATTEIYTLSLHDALPIYLLSDANPSVARSSVPALCLPFAPEANSTRARVELASGDRKSTRLNSSHSQISYAVFCLKKKKILTDNSSPHIVDNLESNKQSA